jgi:hypothetical protein
MVLRLLAGDAIHNLRACVDNLVWCLGQNCGAKNSLSLVFRDTAESFRDRAEKDKLGRLPCKIQIWMEDQQIYSRRDRERSTLHKLNILWNGDKHRVPALMVNAAPTVIVRRAEGELVKVTVDGTEDGEAVVTTDGEGDLNPEFEMDVSFPEINERAIRFLRDVHHHIREDVLPRFEPYLGRGDNGGVVAVQDTLPSP